MRRVRGRQRLRAAAHLVVDGQAPAAAAGCRAAVQRDLEDLGGDLGNLPGGFGISGISGSRGGRPAGHASNDCARCWMQGLGQRRETAHLHRRMQGQPALRPLPYNDGPGSSSPTLVQRCQGVLAPDELALIQPIASRRRAGPMAPCRAMPPRPLPQARFIRVPAGAKSRPWQAWAKGLSRLVKRLRRRARSPGAAHLNSWFNVRRPGSLLRHHAHPASYVSARCALPATAQ